MKKWLLLASLSLVALPARAAERAIPPLTGPVMDETGTLSSAEDEALSEELRAYPPKVQLQIWIIGSLEGEPIESLAIRAADKWKLGTAKEDRGAILLVAIKDHRARIEVGQGLEGDIPDALAGRIIDHVLAPAFRQGNYFGGLQQASRVIFQRAGGDVTALKEAAPAQPQGRQVSWLEIIIVLVFFGVWALPLLFGSRRSRFGGGGGWWGGGGGGFGGGGFGGGGGGWSGGGGGFSGGGASGDW